MKRNIIIVFSLFTFMHCYAQNVNVTNLMSYLFESDENIQVTKLYSDSLATSFLIEVRDSVRFHKHEFHAEHIYVLQGIGEMQMNDSLFVIQSGDYFAIPLATKHGVRNKGIIPLKVLSIQTPEFYGKDRVFVE